MFVLLAPARSVFYRLSRVDQAGLSVPWALGIAAILGVATWVGFLSYRDVDYSHALWFSFDLHGDAQRFLRGTLALSLAAAGILAYFVLQRSDHRGMDCMANNGPSVLAKFGDNLAGLRSHASCPRSSTDAACPVECSSRVLV